MTAMTGEKERGRSNRSLNHLRTRFLVRTVRTCLVIYLTTALIGFPTNNVVAQSAGGEAGEGTVPLLREPARVLSEQQCADLSKTINFLQSPDSSQKLRSAMDSVDRLVAQAREGKREADEALRGTLAQQASGYLKDLVEDKLKVVTSLQSIRALAQGQLGAGNLRVPLSKLDIALGNLASRLQAVTVSANAGPDLFLKQISSAQHAGQAAQNAQRSLLDAIGRSDVQEDLKNLGDQVSSVGPPFAHILWTLGYLGIQATAGALDTYWSGQNLATLEDASRQMHNELMAMDIDLDNDQYSYNKFCHQATPSTAAGAAGAAGAAEEVPPPPTPAPQGTAEAPSTSTPKPGLSAGAKAALVILGVVAVAGAVVLGAKALSNNNNNNNMSSSSCPATFATCCPSNNPGMTPVSCALNTHFCPSCPSGTIQTGPTGVGCGATEPNATCITCGCP